MTFLIRLIQVRVLLEVSFSTACKPKPSPDSRHLSAQPFVPTTKYAWRHKKQFPRRKFPTIVCQLKTVSALACAVEPCGEPHNHDSLIACKHLADVKNYHCKLGSLSSRAPPAVTAFTHRTNPRLCSRNAPRCQPHLAAVHTAGSTCYIALNRFDG